ncbi:hypothetical protein [Methylobacterium sp. ap11]|uniref:hypothetical protein n=1 Tax=Methylobacterium sp. ap11 TaxID=1761799 RepID=UPI000B878FBB|nr:hypothetical protein [Methylobacterium sp. ap11]
MPEIEGAAAHDLAQSREVLVRPLPVVGLGDAAQIIRDQHLSDQPEQRPRVRWQGFGQRDWRHWRLRT